MGLLMRGGGGGGGGVPGKKTSRSTVEEQKLNLHIHEVLSPLGQLRPLQVLCEKARFLMITRE